MKWFGVVLLFAVSLAGCHKHRVHVTAVPLSPQNQCDPEGIPYYLPKPLLVVAKNVRHIDESKVGLTTPAPIPNAFDDQSSYGSLKANVTVPGTTSTAAATGGGGTQLPSAFGDVRSRVAGLGEQMTPAATPRLQDQLQPDSFFTYQIVFVPDLSQKYALQIKGGPGEVRAAMNLVNGWMYTGMGPYYMKNSSTAQNIMSGGVGAMFAGRGVADVVSEVGDLAKVAGGGAPERAGDPQELVDYYTSLARALQSESVVPQKMLNYAEVYIYEPTLMDDGSMSWTLIAEHHFDRDYFQPAMNPQALKVFENIITQSVGREQQQGSKERAPAGGGMERSPAGAPAAGGMSPVLHFYNSGPAAAVPVGAAAPANSQPPLNPADQMAPANSNGALIGSNGAIIGAGGVGPAGPAVEDAAIDQATRKMLRLPAPQAAGVNPQTQVNVNVNPPRRQHVKPQPRGLHSWFHKDPPKNEARTQRVFSLNPLSGFFGGGGTSGGVGDSVTSNATMPGQTPGN